MQEMALLSICDMTYAQTEERVPATGAFFLAFGTDPNRLVTVQLDLTDDWATELEMRIRPFLAAGHPPGEVRMPTGRNRSPGSSTAARVRNAWAYNGNMRTWADANGMSGEYRKLEKGGYYHSERLRKAYAAYLTSLAAAPAP